MLRARGVGATMAQEGPAGGEPPDRHSLGGPLLKFEQAVADFRQVLAPGARAPAPAPDGPAGSPAPSWPASGTVTGGLSWSDSSVVSPGAPDRALSPTVRAPDGSVKLELVAWDALERRLLELTEDLRGEFAADSELRTVSSKLDGALAAFAARQMVEEMVEQQVEQMSGQLQEVLQQSTGVATELGRLDGMLRSAQQWEEEFNSKLHALNQVQIQDQSELADLNRELSAIGKMTEALSGLDRKLRADNRNLKADMQESVEHYVSKASLTSPAVSGAPAAGAGASADEQEGRHEGVRQGAWERARADQPKGRVSISLFAHTFQGGAIQGIRAWERAKSMPTTLEETRGDQDSEESSEEDAAGGGLAGIVQGLNEKIDRGLMVVDQAVNRVSEKIDNVENVLKTLKHTLRNI